VIPFAYLDSSVILRVLLGQPDALAEWKEVETGVASALVEVECLRTLDRLRLMGALSDDELAERRTAAFSLVAAMEVVEVTRTVLARASQPLPTALGTLDALHLASASLWREQTAAELVLATHDAALGRAARASGFRVIGIPNR
jgi:predicted nucleic acid-binding protein